MLTPDSTPRQQLSDFFTPAYTPLLSTPKNGISSCLLDTWSWHHFNPHCAEWPRVDCTVTISINSQFQTITKEKSLFACIIHSATYTVNHDQHLPQHYYQHAYMKVALIEYRRHTGAIYITARGAQLLPCSGCYTCIIYITAQLSACRRLLHLHHLYYSPALTLPPAATLASFTLQSSSRFALGGYTCNIYITASPPPPPTDVHQR